MQIHLCADQGVDRGIFVFFNRLSSEGNVDIMKNDKIYIIPFREKFLTGNLETFTEKEFGIPPQYMSFQRGGALMFVFIDRVLYIINSVADGLYPKLILHLFADCRGNSDCRLMINTKPGSRLHACGDSRHSAMASKNATRTSRAKIQTSVSAVQATRCSDRVFKSCFHLFHFSIDNVFGPFERAVSFADAQGVCEKFSRHRGCGFFQTASFAYSAHNPSDVFIGAVCYPGGLLEHPSEQRRPHLGDMTVADAFPGLGNSWAKACVRSELFAFVETHDVACFSDDGGGGYRPYSGNAHKKFINPGCFGKGKDFLFDKSFEIGKAALKVNNSIEVKSYRKPVDSGELRVLREYPFLGVNAEELFGAGKIGFERNPAEPFSGRRKVSCDSVPEPYKFPQTADRLFRNIGDGKLVFKSKQGKQMGIVPVGLDLSPDVGFDTGRIRKIDFADQRKHKFPEPMIKTYAFNSNLTLEAV